MTSREPASAGQGSRLRALRGKYFLTLLVIIVATLSLVASAYTFHWFNSRQPSCGTASNGPRYFHFTIVISLSGYNDSQHHNRPWPTMNATVDWDLNIHILNNDTTQPYGFAITNYFDQGVILQPGKSCDLAFFASEIGTFSVYNTIFDTTGCV